MHTQEVVLHLHADIHVKCHKWLYVQGPSGTVTQHPAVPSMPKSRRQHLGMANGYACLHSILEQMTPTPEQPQKHTKSADKRCQNSRTRGAALVGPDTKTNSKQAVQTTHSWTSQQVQLAFTLWGQRLGTEQAMPGWGLTEVTPLG